jgi:hypothetical protein
MFLSGVLFVLFLAGCWLYCLTDAALTPASEFGRLPKGVWVAAIAMTFALGALAWVIVRHATRSARSTDAYRTHEMAYTRHPASLAWQADAPARTCLIGPDDDPEFLQQLSERIRGTE